MFKVGFFYLSILVMLGGCRPAKDYHHLPAKSKTGSWQAVIEIPAGTNKKIEYYKEKKTFLPDQREGQDRVINFLPYPGNYGFIPSTFSNPASGGDGDALDVLVLSESVKTGTVLEILPVAILKLQDNNEDDHKIIAIPADRDKRILDAATFTDLKTAYPEALDILEIWFFSYDAGDVINFQGWGDEKEAIEELRKNKHKVKSRSKIE